MRYYVEIPEENRECIISQLIYLAGYYGKKVTDRDSLEGVNILVIDDEDFTFHISMGFLPPDIFQRLDLTDLLTKGLPKVVDYSKWVGLPVWVNSKICKFSLGRTDTIHIFREGDQETFTYLKLVTKEELLEWAGRVGGGE